MGKYKIELQSSLNSLILSILFKKNDAIDHYLCELFCKYLMRRADELVIVRRTPKQVS